MSSGFDEVVAAAFPSQHDLQGANYFAKTFPKIAALVVDYKRCGRRNCRCVQGVLHGPYYYLRWREGARQRRRYLRAADVAPVRAILAERRTLRAAERAVVALSMSELRRLRRIITESPEHHREAPQP